MKKIYVVGIGPGEYEQMTIRAVKALESCDVIIGYTVYVDLVREHFAGKEFLTTPMKQEVERCRMAFEKAEFLLSYGDERANLRLRKPKSKMRQQEPRFLISWISFAPD